MVKQTLDYTYYPSGDNLLPKKNKFKMNIPAHTVYSKYNVLVFSVVACYGVYCIANVSSTVFHIVMNLSLNVLNNETIRIIF